MAVLTDPRTAIPAEAAPDEEVRRRAAGTAGSVAVAVVAELVDRLHELDGPVRRDEPDAVHQMRVTTRRLRSWFATARPVLDRDTTDPLRAELRWLANALGHARDAEVQRDRLAGAARALPSDLVLGPVVDRIDTELRRRKTEAMARVVEALDSDRHQVLLADLDHLVRHPPLTARAARGRRELARMVDRSARRVERAAAEADPWALDAVAPAEPELEALHELRKAAKRARYSAEAVAGTLGPRSERLASRMEDLHDALGEHQDSVDARTTLRAIGVVAHLHGENGFSFGLLHGIEAARSADALLDVPHLVRRATGSKRP